MTLTVIILLLIISYLIGSIPGGYLLTKLVKNDDIRNYGSKSTGATNTSRVLGFKLGAVAALIDILKGIVVVSILLIFKFENYYLITLNNKEFDIIGLYALFAVIGHIYPIYLNFRGGKAVATSFGIVFLFTPILTTIGIFVFLLIFRLTRTVSLCSMLSAAFIVFSNLIFYLLKINFMAVKSVELVILYFILLIIIVIRHIPNIKRMIKHEEPKYYITK